MTSCSISETNSSASSSGVVPTRFSRSVASIDDEAEEFVAEIEEGMAEQLRELY